MLTAAMIIVAVTALVLSAVGVLLAVAFVFAEAATRRRQRRLEEHRREFRRT